MTVVQLTSWLAQFPPDAKVGVRFEWCDESTWSQGESLIAIKGVSSKEDLVLIDMDIPEDPTEDTI